MDKTRRQYTSREKVDILREHLIEKTPVSQVCDKHGISPTMFYQWQKVFFENGTSAFERRRSSGRETAEGKKLAKLEAKLQRKDEVMAELLTEHIMLKKSLGEN